MQNINKKYIFEKSKEYSTSNAISGKDKFFYNLSALNSKLFHNIDEKINNIFSSFGYIDKIHSTHPYLEIEVCESFKNDITITEETEKNMLIIILKYIQIFIYLNII